MTKLDWRLRLPSRVGWQSSGGADCRPPGKQQAARSLAASGLLGVEAREPCLGVLLPVRHILDLSMAAVRAPNEFCGMIRWSPVVPMALKYRTYL